MSVARVLGINVAMNMVRRFSTQPPPRGFSAIELMVVMSIMAILTALAAPSFSEMLARYKTSVMADQLVSLLTVARTEAIRRGGNVILSKKTSGINDCSTNQKWSCGVTLWADDDRDGTQDANEPVLRDFDVPEGIVLNNNTGATPAARIILNRWGQANGINALAFSLVHTSISSANRSVCVASGGRIRVVEGVTCP